MTRRINKSTCIQVIGSDGKPRSQRVPSDANGKPLRVGDTVRSNEPGAKWPRTVEAIGDGEHTTGHIRCSDSIAWEAARNFVKVEE